MLQRYTEELFDGFEQKRKEKFQRIKTKKGMESFVKKCRKDIRNIYSLPKEKTPLNARVSGRIKCKGYTIEKILFESRPNFLITANLYIPDGKGPFPGVIGTCGHSNEGKGYDLYQSFSIGLVQKGFMVLIYDPIGQGERFQYDKKVIPGCVAEHITIANQQYMLGEFFGSWRVWDGIRALDYLLQRKEVDPSRIGVTGNSGGGTMTTILAALEDRFTMSAPSCFITTYKHNLQNELPADSEQIPPGIIKAGYEMYDHLTAFAPKPLIILTKEDDFFDQRGSREAFSYLKKVYKFLGKPDNIKMVTGSGGHGYSQDLREAMYSFFCEHAGIEDNGKESKMEIHQPQQLWVTKKGQVVKEGSKRVVDFTREKLKEAEKKRGNFSPTILKKKLSLPPLPKFLPSYRILRPINGYSRIAVETEKEVFAIIKYPVKEGASFRLPIGKEAIIYLPHLSSEDDYRNESLLKNLLKNKKQVFTIDVRGIGESASETCDDEADFFSKYESEFFYASYGIMCGSPLAGRRTFDVLRVIQLLKSIGYVSFEIVGRGLGGLIALYTACVEEKINKITIKNCLNSFSEIVYSDIYRWPVSFFLPGILLDFDIPDMLVYLKKRKQQVRVLEPWNVILHKIKKEKRL